MWTEEEQAIIDAYEQFQVELVAVLVDSERDLTRLRSLASEPVGEAIEASIARRRLEGIGTDGTLHIEVLGIRFFGLDLAEIDVCSWDTTVRVRGGHGGFRTRTPRR
ncbi:MAG: hypothetical protein R2710_26385 [Acidimicrobiales bacterium]